MAKRQRAKAYPRKVFFIEMFTRDISFEDCLLDLVDNSIDALVENYGVQLSKEPFSDDRKSPQRIGSRRLPSIHVSYSKRRVSITDNCGGISPRLAAEEAFRFGRDPGRRSTSLGVYGVGMKRALFKIGNHFSIESRTLDGGFKADVDLVDWAKRDETPQDWEIDLELTDAATSAEHCGTTITIGELHPDIITVLEDDRLEGKLRRMISTTYTLFLGKYVVLKLNGKVVEPYLVPFGASDDVHIASESFEHDGVQIRLYAGLAARETDRADWKGERAGWYVFCNGRAVLVANKDEITGWSEDLPQWQPKYRGFLGMALLYSDDPLLLPWTTSKRGLNKESQVYVITRNRMHGVARPVISFLNRMYKGEPVESEPERKLTGRMSKLDIRDLKDVPNGEFRAEPRDRKRTSQRVCYEAPIRDIERIRKRLRKPNMPYSQIGLHTFKYFLKKECPE